MTTTPRILALTLLAGAALAAPSASQEESADPWAGTWEADGVRLTLEAGPDSGLVGELDLGGKTYPVRATGSEEALEGHFDRGGGKVPLGGALQGGALVLDVAGETHRLSRPGAHPADGGEADLSHVEVGQEYHYTTMGGGKQVWTVREVGPDRVDYVMQTLADLGAGKLQPVGEPLEQTWEWRRPPEDGAQGPGMDAQVEISREVVTISGVELNCMVLESTGSKSWLPADPEWRPDDETAVLTFPPLVKSVSRGNVAMELVAIGGP